MRFQIQNKGFGDFGETGPRTTGLPTTTTFIRRQVIEPTLAPIIPVEQASTAPEVLPTVKPIVESIVEAEEEKVLADIIGISPNGNPVDVTAKEGVVSFTEITEDDSKVFKSVIKIGDVHPQILMIKNILSEKSRYAGNIDSTFDILLDEAIKKIQKANGLPASSQIDATTFNLIVNPSSELVSINLANEQALKKAETNKKLMYGALAVGLLYLVSNKKKK